MSHTVTIPEVQRKKHVCTLKKSSGSGFFTEYPVTEVSSSDALPEAFSTASMPRMAEMASSMINSLASSTTCRVSDSQDGKIDCRIATPRAKAALLGAARAVLVTVSGAAGGATLDWRRLDEEKIVSRSAGTVRCFLSPDFLLLPKWDSDFHGDFLRTPLSSSLPADAVTEDAESDGEPVPALAEAASAAWEGRRCTLDGGGAGRSRIELLGRCRKE